MSKSTQLRPSDRLAYLWLVIAAVLLVFAGGRWVVPLAAWLAPLFLLRFVRLKNPVPGILLAWFVRFVVGAIVVRGILPFMGIAYYVVVLVLTLLDILPYMADRLIAHRLSGFSATLVFPAAFTTFEYLISFGPFGTFNSLANTQYGDLPLMQLVSVTGIWGITFLMSWFASVFNWAWERGFAWQKVRAGGSIYVGILIAVLMAGGVRLALLPPETSTVRVSGLSASQAAVTTLNAQLPQETVSRLLSGKASQSDRALARSAFSVINNDLFSRSQQEAQAGAKIVVWPETSPTGASVLQEDESALIQRAGVLAKQEAIYLDMGLAVFLQDAGGGPPIKDESVLIDPTGRVVWTYEKSHNTPGDQGIVVQGNGKVPMVDSPYGRLANVICFDMDYPGMIQQAGQAGADILLVPSDDWQAVDPSHTEAATFRAVENGISVVRQASKGLSMSVDYQGHVLSESDYFTTDQQVMVAYVPVHGVRTIYSRIGDLFARLSIVGLAIFIVLAVMHGRKPQPQ